MALGSILRAPDPLVHEVSIDITGSEPFPAARVAQWIETVQSHLVRDPGWRVFYMPSTEQQPAAEANLAIFQARGIVLGSPSRWAAENACYSSGWALGKLVAVPGSQITAALADGWLGLGDILVTDRVPTELPVLASYITREPATPNSHIALLAQSFALPFAYARRSGLRAEIDSLVGKDVLLLAEEVDGACQITLKDTTGLLTPVRRQEILDSKRGGAVRVTPITPAGALSLGVDTLTPADLKYVGGKASNFGFLRRSLPQETPHPVIAFTFDLWTSYLDQALPTGFTLREEINSHLSRHTYPPNVAALHADLAAVRVLVMEGADFGSIERAAIIARLRKNGLKGRKIRFRSSTNVEDGESFSGAGLYDSFSGCLEDDLDGDITGPSLCDPAELNERGVFQALKKVYGSFYNENAFLERLRHGVRESDVGMAVLVHFSSPDEDEMANGVATLAIDKSGPIRKASVHLVSQIGSESVTNPDPAKRPEVVASTYTGLTPDDAVLTRIEASSLTENGASVMPWDAAYRILLAQLNTATLAWEHYYPALVTFELDFEFKRT
ncbi:MAG: hypothetical protein EXS36_00815 [Pedosphaera sp.]|nr:hypothetical protein [Pedosphaera sp.]